MFRSVQVSHIPRVSDWQKVERKGYGCFAILNVLFQEKRLDSCSGRLLPVVTSVAAKITAKIMAPRPSIISTDMRALVVWICSADGPCLGRSIDRKEAVSMLTGTAKSCSSCVSGVDNGRRGETSEKSEYMVDTASFDGDDVDARCCRTKNDGEGIECHP